MSIATSQKTPSNPIDKVCASLVSDTFKEKLQQALPPNISAEKFCRIAVNAIQMHPQQDKFSNCDNRTLFISCQKAAADGLMLDGREGTLVAYWNKKKNTNDISYVPMVQGLVKVARNSGEIVSINAHVVYQTDTFKYRPGIDPQPIFEPDWKIAPSKRGEPVLAYCVIELKDKTIIAPPPMHRERIMEIAKGGNNPDQYDPNKGKHWGEWWKKTAIKNALKYAPKSSELLSVEQNDNDGQGFQFERDITPTEETVSINELFQPRQTVEPIADAEVIPKTVVETPQTSQPAKKAKFSGAYTKLYNGIHMAASLDDLAALDKLPFWGDLIEGESTALRDLIEVKKEELNG